MRDQFLCNVCYDLITKSIVACRSEEEFLIRSKFAKRKLADRTPVKTPRKVKRQMVDIGVSPFSPRKKNYSKRTHNWKSQSIAAIQRSKYMTAFKYLLRSHVARRALDRLVKLEVRKEATSYFHGERELSKKVTQQSLHEFSWPIIIEDFRDNMPLLYSAIAGALTKKTNEESKLRITVDDKFGPSIPQLGTAFGILMYTRHPMKFNFLQEVNALEKWSAGSGQKLFQCFQHMGLSKGIKGAVNSVDSLRHEFDSDIKKWKNDIEEHLGNRNRPIQRPPARVQLFPEHRDSSFDEDDDLELIRPWAT